MAKRKNSKAAEKPDTLKYVVDSFNRSWEYARTNYHTRWENNWKLYNNQRVKRGYDGISNVFVPMVFSTIETMVAALAGTKPSFDFLPPKTNHTLDMSPLNATIDQYWDRDQWNIKIQSFIRSSLVFGTGVIYLYWDIDHPVIVNLPLRDFFFNPNAVGMESCATDFYVGRRYLTTKEDLESYEVVDLDAEPVEGSYPMKKRYKNLDEIEGGQKGDETDKEKKDLFYGSTVPDPEHNQIEVLELWTEDRVISIANRSVVIQDEENPYLTQAKATGVENPKGILPFVVQRDYVDESLFYGRGEVDVIGDLQELLNDLTNQNQDAITYTLNPMWNLDPAKADMQEQIQAAPGAVFPLTSDALKPVDMPSIPGDAFNERMNIKNEIREATAISEVTKGVDSDTQTTATEINAQIAQAGQRIGMKITQVENEGFHRLARVVLEMTKLYVRDPQEIQVKGTDGSEVNVFDPLVYTDVNQPMVQLQSSVDAKKQKDVTMHKDMYLALSTDPQINQQELKKIVLPKIYDLDPDEVERLLSPDPTMLQMGMGPEGGGMVPNEMPVEPVPEEALV